MGIEIAEVSQSMHLKMIDLESHSTDQFEDDHQPLGGQIFSNFSSVRSRASQVVRHSSPSGASAGLDVEAVADIDADIEHAITPSQLRWASHAKRPSARLIPSASRRFSGSLDPLLTDTGSNWVESRIVWFVDQCKSTAKSVRHARPSDVPGALKKLMVSVGSCIAQIPWHVCTCTVPAPLLEGAKSIREGSRRLLPTTWERQLATTLKIIISYVQQLWIFTQCAASDRPLQCLLVPSTIPPVACSSRVPAGSRPCTGRRNSLTSSKISTPFCSLASRNG